MCNFSNDWATTSLKTTIKRPVSHTTMKTALTSGLCELDIKPRDSSRDKESNPKSERNREREIDRSVNECNSTHKASLHCTSSPFHYANTCVFGFYSSATCTTHTHTHAFGPIPAENSLFSYVVVIYSMRSKCVVSSEVVSFSFCLSHITDTHTHTNTYE